MCESKITAMCGVNYSMWVGTEDGEVIILDVISKQLLFRRHLSIHESQGISAMYHLFALR